MMYWSNWNDFWNMGGYALYVWASFGAVALAFVVECWQLKRSTAAAWVALNAEMAMDEADEAQARFEQGGSA